MESIKIKNLTKTYGKARGIDNIDLTINKGEIFGFIGPNGAGKSTTIKCIMNLINKNSGDIFINEKNDVKSNYKVKEEIGYLPSEIHLYEDLTVKKMLEYSESFYKKDCSKRKKELVKRLDIDLNKKIDQLSLGNLKKVGIVLALMHQPKIVIMDEATSGLDPLMQEQFYEILEEEKQKGTTIFFSSHILSEIKRICDKVAIIREGKIIKIDTIENLSDSQLIKVTIESDQINQIKEELKLQEEIKNDELKFMYKEDINKLINVLSKYQIKKMLLEESSLEEIFIHYYK